MTGQLVPIIKAVGPYLAQIAAVAIPAFTSKDKSDIPLVKQIEELQSAATQNAQSIQVLAQKVQEAIQGLESAAHEAKQQLSIYKKLLFVSLGLSVGSLAISFYVLVK